MSLSRRKFTKEFKLAAVRRLEMGASVTEIARTCEVSPNLLHRWRREFRDGVDRAFPGLGRKKADENRIAELERKVGRQALEIDFLQRACERLQQARLLVVPPTVAAPSSSRSSKNGSKPRR